MAEIRSSAVARHWLVTVLMLGSAMAFGEATWAQNIPAPPNGSQPANSPPPYVIGPQDVLGIIVLGEEQMSGEVTVRPDGRITLALIGEVSAAGLEPVALGDQIQELARRYIDDPNVTVVVRQINSRQAFITGEVAQPGEYPLTGPRTVLQLIALAGGLTEFAKADKIVLLRVVDGRTRTHQFNYDDVARGRRLEQNVTLQPGDTVVVP